MQEIITREQAKEQGLKRYFTGNLCIRNHRVERHTVDASCTECRRIINREYGNRNKEARYIKLQKWLENPDNLISYKNAKREWKRNNPIKREIYRNTKRASEGTYKKEDIDALIVKQDNKCNGCKNEFSKELKFTIDHIIPISREGTSWPHNLQLLCNSCNCSKHNRYMEEWLEYKIQRAA